MWLLSSVDAETIPREAASRSDLDTRILSVRFGWTLGQRLAYTLAIVILSEYASLPLYAIY